MSHSSPLACRHHSTCERDMVGTCVCDALGHLQPNQAERSRTLRAQRIGSALSCHPGSARAWKLRPRRCMVALAPVPPYRPGAAAAARLHDPIPAGLYCYADVLASAPSVAHLAQRAC